MLTEFASFENADAIYAIYAKGLCETSPKSNDLPNYFQGAFKHLTSNFVSLTEGRLSEHQNSVVQNILLSQANREYSMKRFHMSEQFIASISVRFLIQTTEVLSQLAFG